jgi:hypothetical protein
VDLDRDEAFIDHIKEITRPTMRPEILSSVGGFAGLFKVPERYRDPVFVAGADGVGTKLKLAAAVGRFDTVGIDCVAMVVNDLVVQGAEPIVFLDYLAMDSLEEGPALDALRGSTRCGASPRGAAAPAAPCSGARPRACPVSIAAERSSWWALGSVSSSASGSSTVRASARGMRSSGSLRAAVTATATRWCAGSSTRG